MTSGKDTGQATTVETVDGAGGISLALAPVPDEAAPSVQAASGFHVQAASSFQRVFENAPVGMALVDPDGLFAEVNKTICALTGFSADELLARPLADLTDPGHGEDVGRMFYLARTDESGSVTIEKPIVAKDESELWGRITVSAIREADGTAPEFLVMVEDVTDRRRNEIELRRLAERDVLTGLFNRRRFEEELERHVDYAARYGEGAVFLIDIDHFKYANDALGHQAGDELLRKVATTMRQRLRAPDTLARIGGDEFAALLSHISRAEAEGVAEALRSAVASLEIFVAGRPVGATVSIGVRMVAAGDFSDRVLADADLAMYAAKEHGRNRVVVHEAGSAEASRPRFSWSQALNEALEHERFVLHCQPVIAARSGKTAHHELLLRLPGPDGELAVAGEFVPVADRFGLIEAIDLWVVGEAIALLAVHPDATLAVNLSASSMRGVELLERVDALTHELDVRPDRLIFEISERAAIADMAGTLEFAHALRALGCRISLDNFGTGFGSFSYLKQLPAQYVKLDGEFVKRLPAGNSDRLIVGAMAEIGQGLGRQIVAECVETEAALAWLRQIGVDYIQGFLLGEPTLAEQTLAGEAALSAPPR